MDDKYIWDREGILKIYENTASKKSYGVRDEFRVGYAALQAIADGMDEQVKSRIHLLVPKLLIYKIKLAGQFHG